MLFSSVSFLYYFLPIVLIIYFAVPTKLKNAVLFISSLVFYGWGEPKFLIFMLISITQGFAAARLIEKHRKKERTARAVLIISAVLSLGLLGYCKYADFFIKNFNAVTGLSVPLLKIALPIGISFYTFQILSYVIDVYRGDVKAQKSFISLGAYVAMFPQLIAGPIVRYSDIAKQLESRTHTLNGTAYGILRFCIGLSKKILIADTLGALVSEFKGYDDKTVLFYWIYAVAYTLHIYFDFSGYSDMAIGLGKIFGFDFNENFNYPYISSSITEFWRRWHISLGTWFRDYLYIPLGGNRVKPARHIINIFIVWLATGFWHGAEWTFLIWGFGFAVLLIFEKYFLLKRIENHKLFSHAYVMLFVILSFVLFDSVNIIEAFNNIRAMLFLGELPVFDSVTLYYLKSYAVPLVIAIIGATPLPKAVVKKLKKHRFTNALTAFLEPAFSCAALIICTAFLIDGSFSPFLYFRF